MADYDGYVATKTAKNETPKDYKDYAQQREHWRRGGEAHQAEVDQQVAKLAAENPNANVYDLSSFRDPSGCTTCFPDITVVDTATDSAKFIEVKTGKASWTGPQNTVYPRIDDGTAVLTNQQAGRLGRDPGTTVYEAFPGGAKVETVYGPGYLD